VYLFIHLFIFLFVCLFSEHDLMWTAPGEIVVDKERHTVQSPKFMMTVVLNPIGFHVPCSTFYVLKTLSNGRKFNVQYYTILYNILQMISWSRSQIGGGRPGRPDRPGEHGRTSCGYILIILSHTPRNSAKHCETPRNTAKTSMDYISLN
jgi:hypothetical protein